MENALPNCITNEYGLENLGELPLLERIHRLLHAIQNGYPYKETKGWKSLSTKQKREMLEYIKKRKIEKVNDIEKEERKDRICAHEEVMTEVDAEKNDVGHSDPYLEMIRKRNIRNINSSSLNNNGAEENDFFKKDCIHEVHDTTRSLKLKGGRSRWKVVDEEFYGLKPCFCGEIHAIMDNKTAKSDTKVINLTIRSIMITFGDAAEPCMSTVDSVRDIVGNFTRHRLKAIDEETLLGGPCLRALVELFPQEAIYYGRWREFRTETKQTEDLETIKEEDLAEELDFFAISESNAWLSEDFLTRIKFADQRTQKMDWDIYDSFSHIEATYFCGKDYADAASTCYRDRRKNFMLKKGGPFKEWLEIGACSQASLEFLNFIVYHNIGRLVELAIKYRAGGILSEQRDPLLSCDMSAIVEEFNKSTADVSQKHYAKLKQKKRKKEELDTRKSIELARILDQDKSADASQKRGSKPRDSAIRLKRLR